MSRMSDILIEISEMLEKGVEPEQICNVLHVPIDWVAYVEKEMMHSSPTQEEYE